MKLLGKFIFNTFSNVVALWVAAYFVSGFLFQTNNIVAVLTTAAILTLINAFIKPILSFFSIPLILLTLGLFSLVVNAATLYILDIFSEALTIQGTLPLVYGTLIVTFVTMVLGPIGRSMYKEE
ncbi:MAG: phage holin family protein [bacterium]|nr:phage holin family protein [Candidatus Jorgensenbacteria bacterium]